jgi:hypothetical protein
MYRSTHSCRGMSEAKTAFPISQSKSLSKTQFFQRLMSCVRVEPERQTRPALFHALLSPLAPALPTGGYFSISCGERVSIQFNSHRGRSLARLRAAMFLLWLIEARGLVLAGDVSILAPHTHSHTQRHVLPDPRGCCCIS